MKGQENPYLRQVQPKLDSLKNFSLITRADNRRFLIYDQTHKVEDLGLLRFFHYPIEFLGVKIDSTGTISSLVVYVLDDGNLFSELKREYGEPISSFNSNVLGQNGITFNYESRGWKSGNYLMLFAEHPYRGSKANHLLSRILIKSRTP